MDSVTGKMGAALEGLKGQIGTDHQGEDLSMLSAGGDTDMMTHSQSTSQSIWIPVMAFKTYPDKNYIPRAPNLSFCVND